MMVNLGQLIGSSNVDMLVGYAPLGIIGVWRWFVWFFKKMISFFYKNPGGAYTAKVSIITPVYNEDPEMFQKALLSWKQNKPKEIIAVIDYTDERCIKVFKDFCENFPEGKIIITKKPGKRAALADGIKVARGKIVALVDSDTVWMEDFLSVALGPFEDRRVGGVAPRQDVMDADTLAKKLFRIHIYNRYGNDLIYQAAFGNALSCISGRTGMYRRKAIMHLTDELENETFLGKKCISGDDKRLTNLIQRDGWKVKYVESALVYTPGFPGMGTYLKQQVRWTRNSWRADLTSVTKKWLWKNPFLAFHTIDRFFQPFALLLGPIFLIIAIYKGDWLFIQILCAWWVVSRSIKIIGHLKKHPKDVLIMPVYIIYTYIIAIIKIYTLITVGEQSWITRWDKERLQKVQFFKKFFAYGSTAGVIVALFIASFYVNIHLAGAKSLHEKNKIIEQKKIEKLFKYEQESGVLSINMRQQEKYLAALRDKLTQDSFGYYQVQLFENGSDVRRRFLLAPDVPLFTEDKTIITAEQVIKNGDIVAIRVSDLQNTRSDYYRNASISNVLITTDIEENAIRIKGSGAFITIPELARRLNSAILLEEIDDDEWILRKNLYIDNGVTLIIDGDDVKWLKLYSGNDRFAWIKSENGNILIKNTKITSWDEKRSDFDKNIEDGRSYILQKSSGRMDIASSELSYLGYYGYPNRGNPYGGPYGVSWKIQGGYFKKELSTGSIINSRIHNNLFGVYMYGSTGMHVLQNEIYENIEYGIDPHDDSNHMIIADNNVFQNGSHGIIISKRCFANVIRGNYSHDNTLHGIMLDRDSNNNLVENNYASGNTNGIALYHSSENVIINNHLTDNKIGIRANNFSSNNYVGSNVIEANHKGAYFYNGAANNVIIKNSFSNNTFNIHFKNKSSNFHD